VAAHSIVRTGVSIKIKKIARDVWYDVNQSLKEFGYD